MEACGRSLSPLSDGANAHPELRGVSEISSFESVRRLTTPRTPGALRGVLRELSGGQRVLAHFGDPTFGLHQNDTDQTRTEWDQESAGQRAALQ